MYAVADGDAAATRRHTKGEAVTNGTQKARRRRTVRWQRMAISKQTTINRTLRSHHEVCGRRRRRGGDSVAHKRRGGDEWHTKGEAAANGEVAANGDFQTNNNLSNFKVPSRTMRTQTATRRRLGGTQKARR